jgi:hypothetical protein
MESAVYMKVTILNLFILLFYVLIFFSLFFIYKDAKTLHWYTQLALVLCVTASLTGAGVSLYLVFYRVIHKIFKRSWPEW